MGGSILQLVAKGSEDKYITANPQITFFKMVYKRHTIFSQEHIPLYFNSHLDFGKKTNCKLQKDGDLIMDVWFVTTLPQIKINDKRDIKTKFAWVKDIGFNIIDYVEIEINGKIIDRHYGEWMNLINYIFNSKNIDNLIGNIPELTEFTDEKNEYTLYVPLQFWFCKSSESSLPISCLQFCDIYINIKLNEVEKCYKLIPSHSISCKDIICPFDRYDIITQDINTGIYYDYDVVKKRLYYLNLNDKFDNKTDITSNKYNMHPIENTDLQYINIKPQYIQLKDSHLLVNYVYLDKDERELISSVQHDYFIEQTFYTQPTEIDNLNRTIKINVKNSCKYIIWQINHDTLLSAGLLANDKELVEKKHSSYYNIIQSCEHLNKQLPKNCYMYSFALNPDVIQPTGTLNASVFNNLKLLITINKLNPNTTIKIYSVSYNILRISNGLANLMFS